MFHLIYFQLDYNRKKSVDSAGGSFICSSSNTSSSSSECSDNECPESIQNEIHSVCSDDDCQEVVKKILQHERPMRITIKLHITETKFTKWDSVSFFKKIISKFI